MAVRDRDWPGYTQWYSCPSCYRLWAYQGEEIIVLDTQYALGPAAPSQEIPIQSCTDCAGEKPVPVLEI